LSTVQSQTREVFPLAHQQKALTVEQNQFTTEGLSPTQRTKLKIENT
jgi:hypothetical protein